MKLIPLVTLATAAFCLVNPQQLAADAPHMQQRMNDYFAGERTVGLFLMGSAAASLGAGAYLFAQGDGIYRGISYPLIILGVFQAVIGGTVYFRTDKQVEDLTRQLSSDPAAYIKAESDRMARINNTFNIVKTVEIVFMAAGIVLALAAKSPTWQGVGLGLVLQGAVLFSVDVTAQRRGNIYAEDITQFSLSYKIN